MKKTLFKNTTVFNSSRIKAGCPFTNELSFFRPYRLPLYTMLCAFDSCLKFRTVSEMFPENARVIYALFMQK